MFKEIRNVIILGGSLFMLDNIIASSNIQKALFIMLVGIVGVFSVLIAFFIFIKLLAWVFPNKVNEN